MGRGHSFSNLDTRSAGPPARPTCVTFCVLAPAGIQAEGEEEQEEEDLSFHRRLMGLVQKVKLFRKKDEPEEEQPTNEVAKPSE